MVLQKIKLIEGVNAYFECETIKTFLRVETPDLGLTYELPVVVPRVSKSSTAVLVTVEESGYKHPVAIDGVLIKSRFLKGKSWWYRYRLKKKLHKLEK